MSQSSSPSRPPTSASRSRTPARATTMRTWIALVAGCVAGLFSTAQGAGAVSLQPIGNFNDPIYITSPPGDQRLFVVERPGYIEVVHDGVTSQFLDIHGLTTEVAERGLLSMAFDPNYA